MWFVTKPEAPHRMVFHKPIAHVKLTEELQSMDKAPAKASRAWESTWWTTL